MSSSLSEKGPMNLSVSVCWCVSTRSVHSFFSKMTHMISLKFDLKLVGLKDQILTKPNSEKLSFVVKTKNSSKMEFLCLH